MATNNFRNWPLRRIRNDANLTLSHMAEAMKEQGHIRSIPYFSLLERGEVWPSREIVNAIVRIFKGKLTEMEILYPSRYVKGNSHE